MYNFKIVYFTALSVMIYPSESKSQGFEPPFRVAIIGGGVGGTTAAYELFRLAVEQGLDLLVDLYEPGEIGGRLSTTLVNGYEFETGGSIIHSENMYMQLFTEKFNLSKYHEPKEYSKADVVGFYNGQEFVYADSHYELWSMVKLWWRYGLDVLTMGRHLITPLLSHFKRIYDLQAKGETFDDVHGFLAALSPDFPELLKLTLRDLLSAQGYCQHFLDEFVFLITNINYNQNTDIHAFVGTVALAGGGAGQVLWSVEGGNRQVPRALLRHSEANLIQKAVESVYLMPSDKYALHVNADAYVYDYVIVACPIMENATNLQFENFPTPISAPVKYQTTIVTLVHGELNHTYFGYESATGLPNQIFSVNNSLFFNSISVLSPVTRNETYDRRVFKVFSKELLTDGQLDSLFNARDNVTVIDWLAYPLYDTRDRNLSFVLHKNMYYVNAMEWAASAMEMSAISGVNAALHVLKNIKANINHNVEKNYV